MARTSIRPLRILFFLHATNFDRVFENLLRALLARGHRVEVLVDIEKRRAVLGSGLVFDQLSAEYPDRFSSDVAPPRSDAWLRLVTSWRLALDWLRYLEPEYANAHALRERARCRAPRWIRAVIEGAPRHRCRITGWLRGLEAAVPVPAGIQRLIADRNPDVVLVSPLVGLGSSQGDYVRAARSLGLPVVLPVASWDNLTNKGRLRDVPDLTIVWNAAQVEEAVSLHDLPRERVELTGAHAFDHWFSWSPSTTREAFAAKVGLPADRPILLYVCSSSFIATEEVSFVLDWLRALRSSPVDDLRRAAVIVRPHPQHAAQWEGVDLGEAAVVFPRGGVAPIAEQAKADFYDSLHHCRGVVGINTSAQVEAAVLQRPVMTLLDERFARTQSGTLHFAHLTGTPEAGVVTVASSWGEHLAQLASAITDPGAERPRLEGFLRSFVRPHGLSSPAAPLAAAAVERAAFVTPLARSRRLGRLAAALDALTPLLALWQVVSSVLSLRLALPKMRYPTRRTRRRTYRVAKRLTRSTYRRTRMAIGKLLGRKATGGAAPERPNGASRFPNADPEAAGQRGRTPRSVARS